MGERSWRCTLLTQLSLCFILYLAFNVVGSRRFTYNTANLKARRVNSHDTYFISVRGGSRSHRQQNHLLAQMEKVAKSYKVQFVVNISELGKDDLLMLNGTLRFPSLKVPWYTTKASEGEENKYFMKQIVLAHGKTLDVIVVDTMSLQDYFDTREAASTGSHQLDWLMKTLEVTNSNWRIVIGLAPVIVCEEHEEIKVYEPLHHFFLKYGVNAYLSKQGCTNKHYTRKGSITYIGNPGPTDNPMNVSLEGNDNFKEVKNGFVLHRVSPLEIVSYFIDAESQVVAKSIILQRGREYM